MLLSTAPSLPLSGSGSQPGQYTGMPTRFASFCHATGSGHVALAGAGAASAFRASLPQPEATTERPRSRHNASSPLTRAIVARLHGDGLVADQLADALRADEHRVDARALEGEHLVAARHLDLGDRELARRHVGQELQH